MRRGLPRIRRGGAANPPGLRREVCKILGLMSAFWWDPVGREAGPTGKGRDWGQWGGPSCPPPLNLHQLPDMSHKSFPNIHKIWIVVADPVRMILGGLMPWTFNARMSGESGSDGGLRAWQPGGGATGPMKGFDPGESALGMPPEITSKRRSSERGGLRCSSAMS
jgi:hypothetical protein